MRASNPVASLNSEAHGAGPTAATQMIPDTSGGEEGAPLADATRPKLADGGAAAALGSAPDALPVAAANHCQNLNQGPDTEGSSNFREDGTGSNLTGVISASVEATILSWNCRGGGSPVTARDLQSLVQANSP